MADPQHNPFAIPGKDAASSSSKPSTQAAQPFQKPMANPFAKRYDPAANPSTPTGRTFPIHNPFAPPPFVFIAATDPFSGGPKNFSTMFQNKQAPTSLSGQPYKLVIKQAEPHRKDLPPLDVVAEQEANIRAEKEERELERKARELEESEYD